MTTHSQLLNVTGANLIAGRESRESSDRFTAFDPRTGDPGELAFPEATPAEVAQAADAAAEALDVLRAWPAARIAGLLRAIAAHLEDVGDALIHLADSETALGPERLAGERARTCAQLRAFASVVEDGWHHEAIIDHRDPQATPPRPDLRRMQTPIGPVAVFGASNFPLAFSVPGGDTASALAAGCPGVAKGHPSHPGTSELCARVILAAAEDVAAPSGVFSLVHGRGHEVGQSLVLAPQIRAVGFTGSYRAGRALFDLGAGRQDPIPVYAEMGSVNPVIVTRRALAARGEQIAEGFVASMTAGAGQFCTKPGIVFAPEGDEGLEFVGHVARLLRSAELGPMLNEAIWQGLGEQLAATAGIPGVETVVWGARGAQGFRIAPSLFKADAKAFVDHPQLRAEHFGPSALVVTVPDGALSDTISQLDGGLTATVHAEDDEADLADLRRLLEAKAGRLVWNGFPTGAAVTFAQHHGGPYPATTAPAHTSVGATAIRRFQRPIAYQDFPDSRLPAELRESNPLNIPRLVDGRWVDRQPPGTRKTESP
ncbi:MAG TPA: aldehyde dehydrogenase (NADP(+)) [Egibacteraceae bacterium]|nr:aldehyde dehydrogenase (NADP(+)) [Egibacteraceae bacterium]